MPKKILTPPTAVHDGPYEIEVGVPLNVSASSSISHNGSIRIYRWQWGDGSKNYISAGPSAVHVYKAEGIYNVRLSVEDAAGLIGAATTKVSVGIEIPDAEPEAILTILDVDDNDDLGPADYTVDSAAEITAILAQIAAGTVPDGSIIDITPGIYEGSWTFPIFEGTETITFRSGGTLPSGRVSPGDLAQLAVLRSTTSEPPLYIPEGAHDYRFIGIGLTQTGGNTYDLARVGLDSTNLESLLPQNIEFDRCYLYVSDGMSQRRGFGLNCGNVIVRRCYVENIKDDSDSQAVSSWNGLGPFLIQDNFLEAASENILFGGNDPRVPDLVPSDITILNNTLTKRLTWQGVLPVKNLIELKNAKNVRIAYNTLSNCWVSGQEGYAFVFTPANQDGNAPWCTVEDVLVEYNTVTGVGSGFNITGTSVTNQSMPSTNITIRHNIIVTDAVGMLGADGRLATITHSPDNLEFINNTSINEGTFLVAFDKEGSELAPGFVVQNNLALFGPYGFISDGGVGTSGLNGYFDNPVFTGNVIGAMDETGHTSGEFPPGNTFITRSQFEAIFDDYDNGDYDVNAPYVGKGADIPAQVVDVDSTVRISTAGTTGDSLVSGYIDWDDGTTTTWDGEPETTYEHTYTSTGSYTITLHVEDDAAQEAEDEIAIVIS